MNDRELLELAAKAAGYEGAVGYYDASDDFLCLVLSDGTEWNPLEGDGDALRLAVKLKMIIDPDGETYAYVTANPKGRGQFMSSVNHDGDAYAATRRAIVRAAAEIGRGFSLPIRHPDLPEDNYYKTQAEAEEAGRNKS